MKPITQPISITKSDGSVAIMHFVTKGLLNAAGAVFEREATDENINAEIAKAGIDAVSWRRIEMSEIPRDRTFRNAWVDTGKIDVDMPRAREIHRDKLRAMRRPLLEALDVEYQRADEQGDVTKKAAIAERKQALRDVTADPALEAARTPDELAGCIPDALR
jgi:hypothetical protein